MNQPVDDSLVKELLEKAARSPSGGNMQPWRIFVITTATMPAFVEHIRRSEFQKEPAYTVLPPNLKSPYRDSVFKLGKTMCALLGISRDDEPVRLMSAANNYEFFGAPTGLFCHIDKCMGSSQWSDLGMFLQTFMLLAQGAGLGACAQKSWASRSEAVDAFIKPAEELMLFCGMSIGYPDENAPVNTLVSEREPIENWAQFL